MNPLPSPEVEVTEDYWLALLDQGENPIDHRAPLRVPASTAVGGRERPACPSTNADDGHLPTGELRRASFWDDLETWRREGRTFQAPVIGCNKGGLLVRVRDGIAFLPASQLVDLPCSLGTERLRAELEQLVGREYDLRLIEVDQQRNRVICSARAAHWAGDEIASRLDVLDAQVGSETEGAVRSLCEFGAFVDLGGIDGLIHVSELSWQRVGHPSEVLSIGQTVRVLVLNVDRESRRVGLSLKRLFRNPWPLVAQRHAVGDVIDATITNVVDFGAFAIVEEGVEGLVHISELAEGPFDHPSDVVNEGQQVRARILHIDVQGRRLGLSMRQA
jgi:small subunit ribosomal protein S1